MANPDALRLAVLTELREAAGLTQSDMAQRCGLNGKQARLTAGAWEMGKMTPSSRRRIHFSGYLWDDLGLRADPARFAEIWEMLCEEWGWDPLTDQEWHRLTNQPRPHSSASEPSATVPATRAALTTPPFQAPALLGHFVGRTDLLAHLTDHLTTEKPSRVVALVGMGGIGKTTLATQIAHTLRTHFRDGVLWAQTAISTPLDILQSWARAFGYDYSELRDVESCAAALRSTIATRQLLLILDNVESVQQVRPLLIGGERSRVLLTARSEDAAVALGAQSVPLAELTGEESTQLLVNLLGGERVANETAAATQIGALLHHLPLAVEIVGQLLAARSRRPLAQMAQRLQDVSYRLDLQISDRDVRTSFLVSWEVLDGEHQRAFAHLAVFAGRSFTVPALAALLGEDEDRVWDQLDLLVARSLVKEVANDRYSQHPLLADFAREQLGEAPAVWGRFAEYYLGFVQGNQEKYDLLSTEWENISAAMKVAYQQERWQLLMDYADTLSDTWLTQARYADARQAYPWIHQAALHLQDKPAIANNLMRWGMITIEQNDYDEAERLLTTALEQWMNLEDDFGVAQTQLHLARIAIDRSAYDSAEDLLSSCHALHELLQDDQGVARDEYYQARIHFARGEQGIAEPLLRKVLLTQGQVPNNREAIPTLRLLAQIAARNQDFHEAQMFCQQAQVLCEALHDEAELATVFYTLAILERRQKRYRSAKTYAEQALPLFQKLGLRRLEGMMLYQLGAILKELHEEQTALAYVQTSIEIFDTVQNALGTLFSLVLLGDLYEVMGEHQASWRAWTEAHQLACELEHTDVLTQLHARLSSTEG